MIQGSMGVARSKYGFPQGSVVRPLLALDWWISSDSDAGVRAFLSKKASQAAVKVDCSNRLVPYRSSGAGLGPRTLGTLATTSEAERATAYLPNAKIAPEGSNFRSCQTKITTAASDASINESRTIDDRSACGNRVMRTAVSFLS